MTTLIRPARHTEPVEDLRKTRTDPERLRAFARRLNLMLGEMGLPERRRAKAIQERVGVSGTTASNWLRGQSYPSFEELGRMQRLGLDPRELFPDATERATSAARSPLAQPVASTALDRLIAAGQVTPLLQLLDETDGWNHTALPNALWGPFSGAALEGWVVVLMRGDAMGERLRDGTPLIVDTRATAVDDDNGLYALLAGDTLMVRRVQRRLQGGYLVACDNPAISAETVSHLRSHRDEPAAGDAAVVLGRVVAAIQRL
jgi:transcriptional regulator with XRE-family HTH domain